MQGNSVRRKENEREKERKKKGKKKEIEGGRQGEKKARLPCKALSSHKILPS